MSRMERVQGLLACLLFTFLSANAETNWASIGAITQEGSPLEFQVTGVPGALYKIECSTNMTDWSAIGLTLNQTGVVRFQPPACPPGAGAFFRVQADSPAQRIAKEYCSRASVTSPNARLDIYRFVDGVDQLGLLPHLTDFAFFSQGMQPESGMDNPVSWRNTGTIVGSVQRFRGGFALPNYLSKNHFFFTNLPPTPNGRSLVLWAAANMERTGVPYDNDVAMVQLAAGGTWPLAMSQLFYSSAGYRPCNWNGSSQQIGANPWYLYSGLENSPFCVAMCSSARGYEYYFSKDNRAGGGDTETFRAWRGTDDTHASPAVIRFGLRTEFQPNGAWNGLYRGFAYFDTVLSSNQVQQIDALLPRIGLVIEGDSKSCTADWIYWKWWMNNPETWGLYVLRTNSSVSGTRVSCTNSPLKDSMEERFPLLANVRTNARFPLTLYSLRGGHNDFVNIDKATQPYIDNAFTAITNLWAMARSNGCQVVGWTIDRTSVTWSPGNSNFLVDLNNRLRAHSNYCDHFFDNEAWYVANYGQSPFTNVLLYRDGVHDNPAAPYIGTNMLEKHHWPGLGYEAPGPH